MLNNFVQNLINLIAVVFYRILNTAKNNFQHYCKFSFSQIFLLALNNKKKLEYFKKIVQVLFLLHLNKIKNSRICYSVVNDQLFFFFF